MDQAKKKQPNARILVREVIGGATAQTVAPEREERPKRKRPVGDGRVLVKG